MINGRPYSSYKYEQVLKEQLLIAYLSKGAVTLSETNDLPINDRKILLNTLRQVEEEKKKRIQEIKDARKYDSLRGNGRKKK
jgi:hypothetical protein